VVPARLLSAACNIAPVTFALVMRRCAAPRWFNCRASSLCLITRSAVSVELPMTMESASETTG
jgi:hypothetical protein